MLLLGIHEHAERSFRPEQAIVDLLRDSNTKAVTLLKKEEEKLNMWSYFCTHVWRTNPRLMRENVKSTVNRIYLSKL